MRARCECARGQPSELSTCKLGVKFHIISLMRPGSDGGGGIGAFNAQAKVETWVEPTDITVTFDKPLVIKDPWNADILDGGVRQNFVKLRLKKQPGSWYGERKSAFGFSADGTLGKLPKIACTINNQMPTPPPPSPPTPPPEVPPFYTASQRACFLGGGATFTDAPDSDPVGGWMRPWTVSVKLERWVVGTQVVLDFSGPRLP